MTGTLSRLRLLRSASWRDVLRHVAKGLGLSGPRSRRSVWVHGETTERFEEARELLELLRRRAPQLGRVFTSSDPAVVDALARRFPDDATLLAPLDADLAVAWFFRLHAPRALVTLGPPGGLGPRALEGAARRGAPAIALERGAGPEARRAWEAIAPLVPEEPATTYDGATWRVPTIRDRIGRSLAWRALVPLFARRRIDSIEALRERLGRPRSILCLGNGPSSEEPALASVEHDCLMRVNHRWRDRGLLASPDVVFVGDRETLRAVRGCLFAFGTQAVERGMLLRRLWTQGPSALEYFTADRIAPAVRGREWGARPTNGAFMIAVAAALRPERLTIAGVDLYLHEGGRYPGDPLSENDYAPAHSREVDVAIIRAALEGYRGDVSVVGDRLRERLPA